MTFLYPLGLLGLIGIPIIILIYILQSKYTEQTVNSTYIWHLSDKFLKRKNPLSGMTGIISLILQLLLVAIISLAVSRPIITLPGAAYDYCFVLDASSSMTMAENESTRFDLAKDEIEKVIKSTKNGSSYTLITVSNDTVTAFDGIRDKKQAIKLLDDVYPSQTGTTEKELLSAAQNVFDANPSTKIYLVTDKSYEKHDNLELIDVGLAETENYALFDVEYSHLKGVLEVSAKAISYNSDKQLKIELIVDGQKLSTVDKQVSKGTLTEFFISGACESFSEFTVQIADADGYALDNQITSYNTKSDKTYSVLIVSETGFFFKAVIDALVDSQIDIVDPDEYETVTEKYGLYIFDSYEPPVLPDGPVWLINADESIENSGFGVRGKVEIPSGDTIEKSNSTSTQVRKLLEGISNSDIYITNYIKYSGMYLNFHTLFTYESNPVIFAGANGLGNRQVVFGFDLHESDFALTPDFVILMQNLLEYSFPDVIDETNYVVGEEALVNILANASNLKAVSPSGKDIYIETDGATTAISLTEVGTYVITMTFGGNDISYKLYSSADPAESEPSIDGEEISVLGEKTDNKIDGKFDPLYVFFVLIALIFLADWGVYLYEKYQLR